jgi:hypothetical protein
MLLVELNRPLNPEEVFGVDSKILGESALNGNNFIVGEIG